MKNFLKILFLLLSLWAYSCVLANVQKFDITTTPSKVKIWEAIDITIKALDKDGNIVKNFEWEVLIFSQSDPKAEFPGVLSENTYKFKAADAGQVKFENAVKFTKAGIQDINVYDTSNEDVFGLWEVEVSAGSSTEQKWDITITAPENGITLGSNTVKVTGTTLKNHNIQVILNTDKISKTISNGEWYFEVNLTSVPNGENSIQAKILNADEKVIGESSKTLFRIEASAPQFKSIKISPEGEVVWEKILDVEVIATNGLTEVNILLNDMVQKLTEGKSWVYTWKITAPKENGEYKIDVTLKNEIWIETKQNGVTLISVKNIEFTAAPVEETSTWVNCSDLQKELVINNIKLVKMKSKSVLSWDKIEKATSYNLYKKERNGSGMTLIENLTETQVDINIEWEQVTYDDFAVKAVLKNESCEIESKDYSTMTTVQTWPKEIFLILISLFLVWILSFFRRKKA